MAWIRSDCSILSDEWLLTELDGWEFKAWTMFLHRVKAEGARGSVKVTSTKILATQWLIPVTAVQSMLTKAMLPNERGVPRIREEGGRWYVASWKKYQEDFKESDEAREGKGVSPEKTGDGPKRTTPPHSTPQDSTLPDSTLQDSTPQNNTTTATVVVAAAAAATATAAAATAVPVVGLKSKQPEWETLIEYEWGIPSTRVPRKTVQELTTLANKHGTDRVLYAVSEARSHGANHLGYVRAILDPRNRIAEIEREIDKANQIRIGQGKSI